MDFNPYVYILYYQSNLQYYLPQNAASYPNNWNIVFVMEVLEQPGSETCVHNVATIRELRHINIDKARNWLILT